MEGEEEETEDAVEGQNARLRRDLRPLPQLPDPLALKGRQPPGGPDAGTHGRQHADRLPPRADEQLERGVALARLARLEQALEFVSGGHTAGEAMLIEQLAEDGQIEGGLSPWPPHRQGWDEIEVRLTGLIVFGE